MDHPREDGGGGGGFVSRALAELGIVTLCNSHRDVKNLCAQRFVRLFAYGSSTLVLVLHLQALGISKTHIGLFMTLTLWGDVLISFALTLVADAVGRRVILALGAALMAASGAVFALCDNFWVLLAAAIVGVISPSGNEIGPFKAITESAIAHLTDAPSRGDVYAWHTLVGSAGSALGLVASGWLVHHLSANLGWQPVDTYRLVFAGYALAGILKLFLSLLLSPAIEADRKPARPRLTLSEAAPLLARAEDDGDDDCQPPRPSRLRALLPDISRESYKIVTALCLLLGIDSFASGLASLSWLTYFFHWRHGIEEGQLGSIFSLTSAIGALSMLAASSLAKRFGNVRTMVFTHLPSSLFLALVGIPSDPRLALLLLFLRACTQSMDTAPRTAFLAAMILPQERTAVMGAVNVVKTMAQSIGPLITGALSDQGLFWVAFLVAGSLKACYDVGLLVTFKNFESRESEDE
ncbi:putative membrane protein [Escovopsis weberi]|uniref:Putative membrane protein n=1 Tax=Escovopsis weberi TaxID=150374 RepID=A0A0M9VWS7_ESCWE|nr:putative membrane protein [Escovopsis weberi]